MPDTAPANVTLDELRLLFTGDWIHDDGCWDTTPCYSVPLAYEIAKRCDTTEEHRLFQVLYGKRPADDVPREAVDAIRLAAQSYRTHRNLQKAARR